MLQRHSKTDEPVIEQSRPRGSLRQIQKASGVRRETISVYLRTAGIAMRGTSKSHLVGQAAIQQSYRVRYRETHVLLDDLAEAVADGTREEFRSR